MGFTNLKLNLLVPLKPWWNVGDETTHLDHTVAVCQNYARDWNDWIIRISQRRVQLSEQD
jgi:hypothetical protein